MDEAHHSPAVTWSEILSSFPNAKKLLVTATPFRRDRKEIRGTFIFEYPVRKAYEDGVFGKIEYVAVENVSAAENDRAIARTAAKIIAQDREAGFDHFLMVRRRRVLRGSCRRSPSGGMSLRRTAPPSGRPAIP